MLLLETGRRLGVRWRPKELEGDRDSLSTVESTVLAMFGLMIAFSFSRAASRFNEKLMLVADDANEIGTAYSRWIS